MAPIAPFFAEQLFSDLNKVTGKEADQSVHLADFPGYDESLIDKDLEEQMAIAQKASSMILALRRKKKIKVRQPLFKIMVPVLNEQIKEQFDAVKNIILSEVNVKEVEYISDTSDVIKKKIKPNFKALGPKFGKQMKQIAGAINSLTQEDISMFEKEGKIEIPLGGGNAVIGIEDVEIITEDIPGWLVANDGNMTIALDIHISEELKQEGIAREFINKIQNIRKENDFAVTDRILLKIVKQQDVNEAVDNFKEYICNQTLANELLLVDSIENENKKVIEINDSTEVAILVEKIV